ncbi:hypothetical protein ASPBRDRAFT_102062, partial [Aspergillus brasiliensis CBS 101740]
MGEEGFSQAGRLNSYAWRWDVVTIDPKGKVGEPQSSPEAARRMEACFTTFPIFLDLLSQHHPPINHHHAFLSRSIERHYRLLAPVAALAS